MRKSIYLPIIPLLVLVACQSERDNVATNDGDTATRSQTRSQEATRDASRSLSARAEIEPTEGNRVNGVIRFTEQGDTVRIDGKLTGLEPGAHGFHVHEEGDCSAQDAKSAGDHFAPEDNPHGSPRDLPGAHHAGDLGNLVAEADGIAEVVAEDAELQLSGPDSLIGKAVIVHAEQDDFESQPSGDAGARVGCGVIRKDS
ncbi:MAG TPA: superoxide dismutase family protein [Woeseiaceae bacterium]|nr:superoxide dismutase family protein [Woeseiaceae bacterium]